MNLSLDAISSDRIHCYGECPNLILCDGKYGVTAKCGLTGRELMFHDYWLAECDIRPWRIVGTSWWRKGLSWILWNLGDILERLGHKIGGI